jgi:hypothetical protein
VLVDVAPSRISNIARVGDTLYIGAYDHDYVTGDSNTRLLTYDLITGMPATDPIAFQSRPALWSGVGEAWMTDYEAGSIWRLRAGMSPEEIVTGRPRPGAVVAEGGYLYWSESVPPSTQQEVIKRRLITGGAVEPVTSCDSAMDLVVVGNDIYCAEILGGVVKRAPKAGGVATSIPPSTYPIASMTGDGNDLYFVTLKPTAEVYRVPIPNGPAALVHEMTTPARYAGIAVSPTYVFITGDGGVRRIHRATSALSTSYGASPCVQDPVLWNNQLVFVKSDSQVLRCVD